MIFYPKDAKGFCLVCGEKHPSGSDCKVWADMHPAERQDFVLNWRK